MSVSSDFFQLPNRADATTNNQYIIIANGTFLAREIIIATIKGKRVLALDGAADRLSALEITPEVIVGDFDSINLVDNRWGIKPSQSALIPYKGNFQTTIVYTPDQNFTDLVKAIRYCDQVGASQIEILCALGGRMDHHEATLRALRSEYKKGRAIYLHTEQQTISFGKNEEVLVKGQIGDKCGVLAYPKGSFSSKGLKFEVEKYHLNFGFAESIGNSLVQENPQLKIDGEALLILPPHFIEQRHFASLSLVEQLELQLRDAKALGPHEAKTPIKAKI